MNQFTNIDALKTWLRNNHIDYDEWGHSSSKSIFNLWQELEAGEIRLNDHPPLRVVDVVQLIIRRDGTILVEAEQEFFNGKRRFRNQPPAEKIKPGESVQEAAHRCLQEELGISSDAVVLYMESHQRHQTNTNSVSYPGLPSQYNFHLLEAAVSGLPEEDFWHVNQTNDIVDPVKRHRWVWRPMNSIRFIAGR